MSRNTIAEQKRARNFHKSDALAQTNQIKYDCIFFLRGTENIKKFFSQDLKLETKIPGTFFIFIFYNFILFFNIAVEKLLKNSFGEVRALEKDFSKPRISQFRVQILEIR